MTRTISLIAALILALLVLPGCSGGGPKTPVNVIVITLDTTRADHLGCYGNPDIGTPNLNRFAGESVLFRNAYSTVASTLPSHVSIFTSLYMRDHGVLQNRQRVPDIPSMMPKVFKAEGYETAGFTSGGHLNDVSNIDQGYDYFEAPPNSGLEAPAGLTTENAITWLNGRQGGPLFLWVHYFDPHFTYEPPSPYREMYRYSSPQRVAITSRSIGDPNKQEVVQVDPAELRGLYMGEVSYMDAEFGRLIDSLKRLGLYEDSVIVVVADHGESLGEHDIYFNHAGLFDTTLHVPLMIRLPGGEHAGVRDQLVSTVDIYPTVLGLALGSTPEAPAAGHDLAGIIDDPSAAPLHDVVYFQGTFQKDIGIRSLKYLYQRQAYDNANKPDKALVVDPVDRFLLYDCDKDPGQNFYINTQRPDVEADMNRAALEFLQNPVAVFQAADVTNKDQIDKLKALGYVQ